MNIDFSVNDLLGKDDECKLITSATLHKALEEYDLIAIYDAFNNANGHCLTSREFREVLQRESRLIFEDREYESLYAKIDTNSSGAITWDDLISFLILGFEQAAISLEYRSLEPPISTKPRIIHSNHRSYVTRIIFCPTLKSNRIMNWSHGSYMTLSKDGIINYWSLGMDLERTVYSKSPELKITTTWVTDMVVMPDVNVVCTSSTERDLRFYDSSARKFELRVMFSSVDYAVTTMCYYFSENVNEESKLILGDMKGNVKVLFVQSAERGPFKSILGLPLLQTRFENVKQGLVYGFKLLEFKNIHSEFVRQVSYYKTLHSIVSCSSCIKTPLAVTDITDPTRKQDPNMYKVPLGVWCFDLLDSVHILATGGPDCLVRIWNPFVPSRPTATLYRHHEAIIQICFQDNGKTLYSLSKDKNIKVWDIASQTMIQNYMDLPSCLGEKKEMTTLYNPESRQWIVGSAMIAIVPLSPKQSYEHTDGNTHCSGVSVVLYNKLFQIIVTVGIDSYILVWNPWDGRRMLVIKEAHVRMLHGVPIPVEITAATFSQNLHFLLTGAHDGSLKIWDFKTGTCLRNMKLEQILEISEVFWVGSRVLAAGWNSRITEFNDKGEAVGQGGSFSKNWDKRHLEDISAAAVRIPQALVTASFDGDIIMWKLETGQPYKKYNVSNPTVRIKIKYKLPKYEDKDDDAVPEGTQAHTSIMSRKSLHRRQSVLGPNKKLSNMPAFGPEQKYRRVSVVYIPEECLSLRKLAVHFMMFLNTRDMNPKIGTLLISLENGVIQLWSHDIRGGFITSFSAIHKAGDYVICMATDENNEFLFTGHSSGFIKTWLLKNYCTINEEPICFPKYRLRFPFLWGNLFIGRAQRISGDLKPLLLNSYKGHFLPISSLDYINESEILISGSADRSVRLWTLSGRFIQTIGSFKGWKNIPVGKPIDEKTFKFTVPSDLKRVISSTTLRVFLGGSIPRQMTKKQQERRAEKERIGIDDKKVYGKPLESPLLGHFYELPKRTTTSRDVTFDTNFPYIPVYQHLIMPQPEEVKIPDHSDTAKPADEKLYKKKFNI